jgi:hypothetical protein
MGLNRSVVIIVRGVSCDRAKLVWFPKIPSGLDAARMYQ